MSEQLIRRAASGDIDQLAQTLSRAFHHEAFHCWLFPDESVRLRQARRLFTTELRSVVREGVVFTNQTLTAASLWGQPGRPAGFWSQCVMPLTLFRMLGMQARRVVAELRRVAEVRPQQPHWYLSVMGTDPHSRGRGIASAMMRTALAECDATNSGAWLETASLDNAAFYQKFSFTIRQRVQLSEGLQIVGMWRDPRNM